MEKTDSRKLVLDEIHLTIQLQKERRMNMETKGGILLGFLGGILALMVSGYSALSSMPIISRLFAIGAVALFLSSVVCLTFILRTRNLRIDPDPRAFAENYRLKSLDDTMDQLISILIDAFEENEMTLVSIAKVLNWAHLLSGLGIACLVFSLLFSLFSL